VLSNDELDRNLEVPAPAMFHERARSRATSSPS
jgi:hypothetical protein